MTNSRIKHWDTSTTVFAIVVHGSHMVSRQWHAVLCDRTLLLVLLLQVMISKMSWQVLLLPQCYSCLQNTFANGFIIVQCIYTCTSLFIFLFFIRWPKFGYSFLFLGWCGYLSIKSEYIAWVLQKFSQWQIFMLRIDTSRVLFTPSE